MPAIFKLFLTKKNNDKPEHFIRFLANDGTHGDEIDGLVQESRNSIANALELRLFCTNQSKCGFGKDKNFSIVHNEWRDWWAPGGGLVLT